MLVALPTHLEIHLVPVAQGPTLGRVQLVMTFDVLPTPTVIAADQVLLFVLAAISSISNASLMGDIPCSIPSFCRPRS
jgi:SNF family Na+-dependent transporter